MADGELESPVGCKVGEARLGELLERRVNGEAIVEKNSVDGRLLVWWWSCVGGSIFDVGSEREGYILDGTPNEGILLLNGDTSTRWE